MSAKKMVRTNSQSDLLLVEAQTDGGWGMDLWQLGIAGLAKRIRDREVSVSTVATHYLERAGTLGCALDCIAYIDPDAVIEAARRADAALEAGDAVGPLHGIPLGLKDICDLAGTVTGNGSYISAQDAPKQQDSVVAARLKAAGALILAKTETHEFAIGGPDSELPTGPAKNPWRSGHYPGGSSSGSAAAVASGIVPGAIGTDTGGSIRIPSGYCGLVGMKPTYGRVSRRGVSPLAYSLDHIGPMTWTVEDNFLMLQAISGHDANDPASARVATPDFAKMAREGVAGMKVGVLRDWKDELSARLSNDVVEALEIAASSLEKAGAEVMDCPLSPIEDFIAVNRIILLAEGYALHEQDFRERPGGFWALHTPSSRGRSATERDRLCARPLGGVPSWLQRLT